MTSSVTVPLEEDEHSNFRSFSGGKIIQLLGMPGKADAAPAGCSFPCFAQFYILSLEISKTKNQNNEN